MLEKRDYRTIPGARAEDVWSQAWDYWQRAGFALYKVGPYHFTGASYYSRIGLRREVEVRLQEANNSLYVDLGFRARITDTGAVGGVAAAVIFWPAAAVGGALSWSEYENEASALMASFWRRLWESTGKPSQILFVSAPPFGTPYPPSPPPAPTPGATACKKCGAALAEGWKACPYCGQPTAGTPPAATPSS